VLQVLEAYPKVRITDAGTRSVVHIGLNAQQEIADFLTQNRDFPLVFVVKWYAKNEKFPKNLRNFLADPPSRELWGPAWTAMRREGVAAVRGIAEDIMTRSQEWAALPTEERTRREGDLCPEIAVQGILDKVTREAA
jgi:hypothetical protein